MKIGITCYPTYGGSGVVATELGMELAQRGHCVHFICYDRPYRLPNYYENIFYHEVQVSKYPLFEYPPYSLALASKMHEIALHEKLDILHVHYAIPHATSAILAKDMLGGKIKVVTTLHGTDITIVGADPSFYEITKYSMERSDAVTAVSAYLKDETQKTFNLNKEIEVIHNFINVEKLPESTCKREQFAKADEFILTHVSNFRPVKRVLDVIETAARVLKQIKVKLLMVGDGPDRSAAEALCRKLGIADSVLFLGKQTDINSFLCLSDLFLFPSESESFGLAALEAMAQSVPVISSTAGGVKEVVEHGVNGYLADIGDVSQMASYAVELLSDREKLNRFGLAAFKASKSRFHTRSIIPQYIQLYERVLNSPC
jgi:N-acetyl-alpha-D-glucosaminyl L-malate synthase BshA